MSETVKSKLLWSGIGVIIAAIITDVYNFVKVSLSYETIPTIIPIILAVAGFSLIGYDIWKRRRERQNKLDEIKRLEEGDDKRKREKEWRFFPAGST